MGFSKLDIIQGIDFTSKNSFPGFLSASTHVFYARVLQFKNAISMTNNI